MAMAASKLRFFFCPIFINLLVLSIAQADPLYHICSKTGNFTNSSDYKSNLNNLLSSFSSNTKIDYGFYNDSYGQNNDKVNAISLCRGDKKPETCRSCITNSSQVLTQLCPNQKEAYIWYDDCMLRYSNRSIVGIMEFGPYFWMYNTNNVTDEKEFHEKLNVLLGNLTNLAALGDSRRKFAAGNATAEKSQQTMYALVQCTPDLTQQQCSNCLNQAIELIPTCCSKRQGGRVISPSCHFRYEKDPFYELVATTPPPSPAPLSVLPPPPSPAPLSPFLPRIKTINIVVVCIYYGHNKYKFVVDWTNILALAKAQQPADQPVLLYKECVGKGNYTTNSTYQANLNQLLTSIYTNTEINNGFYNFSYGQDADTVYSIALCRPDISPGACRSCIRNASDSLVRNCTNFVEAIGGLDDCMVRYANRSIFNLLEEGPYFWVYDIRVNVSDVVGFNQSRMTLLDRLRDEAAAGDSRYATGQIAAPNFQTIYALVQCTPDLSPSECRDCLYNASGLIPEYEIDRFYDPSSNSIPPPPDSTSNNSIPSPPASTSQGKKGLKRNVIIIISIVPIAVSVILIVCVCIFLRARRKQKGEEEEEAEDPTLIVGPRNEITRCIIIGLLCVQEKEALRPTMAQVSMMLSSYSVTLAAPSKPAFFMHREDSFPSSVNASRLIESDESRTRSSRCSNNEVTISELDPR
ncbi:hypothetical protein NC651_026297 [Populus alba x Populus x berolinensis]|nr:hypothetical protein NC651_026297 [Populus alba x Populus x berolinensis]